MEHHTARAQTEGHGVAHHGTGHFWRQRLTAIANIPLALFMVIGLVAHVGAAHHEIVAWLARPWVSLVFALLILSALYHARLGMQSVIDDYLRGTARVAAFIFNDFFTFGAAVAAVLALLRIVFVAMGGG